MELLSTILVTVLTTSMTAASSRLEIEFQNDTLMKTFERLDKDTEFAKRQGYFISVYSILKKLHLLGFLKILPVSLTTPVIFIVRKK